MKIDVRIPPTPPQDVRETSSPPEEANPIQPAPDDPASNVLAGHDRAAIVGESRMTGQAMRARLSENVPVTGGRDDMQTPSNEHLEKKMQQLTDDSQAAKPGMHDASALEKEMENLKSGKGASSGHSIDPPSNEYLEKKMKQVAEGSMTVSPGAEDAGAVERELENLKSRK